MVAHPTTTDALEAAEERAAANEWGQAAIALPEPAKASSHWYHFLAVELFPDGYSYTEVTNPTGEYRHERLLTRAEALALLAVRS